MTTNIYCIGISGVRLSDPACDALYQSALRLMNSKKNEIKLYHDDISGVVRTNFERSSMGGTYGYVFIADIVTIRGKSFATFLVSDADKSDGRKSTTWMKRAGFVVTLK